jgi:ABC-type Fe3+-hydroxamate transport system substrate-binding protein
MALRLLDDRDREIVLLRPPQRIVSLVPSDTLSLFALGAGQRLVGRTRYCVLPEGQVDPVAVVGGTKDADVEAIAALAPELIIANQEENTRAQLEELGRRGLQLYVSFPKTVRAGINHLARLARLLGVEGEAPVRELLKRGLRELDAAEEARKGRTPLRVFVPIWREPLMTCAGDTHISDALELAGAVNVFADRQRLYPLTADLGKGDAKLVPGRDTRYPRITAEEVVQRAPEAMLLPDEPHCFGQDDAAWLRTLDTPASRTGRVVLCGGRDLMWYGAQAVEGLPRLRALVESLRR